MKVSIKDLMEFEKRVTKSVPGFKLKFKDECWTQKVLGFLLSPLNLNYMNGFASTFGSTVYYPSKSDYFRVPLASLATLAHEYIHILDAKKHRIFSLSYLFPQILGLLPILVYSILYNPWPITSLLLGYLLSACFAQSSLMASRVTLALALVVSTFLAYWLSGWNTFLFIFGLVFLAPWPAPERVRWELRGYTMSLSVYHWVTGRVIVSDQLVELFTGPGYYFMSWKGSDIRSQLEGELESLKAGFIKSDSAFVEIYGFLRQHSLLF